MAVVISQRNVDNCLLYTLKLKSYVMCTQYVIIHSVIGEVLVFSEGMVGK